jgi:uncharacterized protein
MPSINQIIADELNARNEQVAAAVKLLDDGSTVPFIARYRKEITGGLDDTQLRHLEQRLGYLRELEDRRQTILSSISEQGKPLNNVLISGQLTLNHDWKIFIYPINQNAALQGRSR